MQMDFDREKCVALVKEAHEITYHLKAETELVAADLFGHRAYSGRTNPCRGG